MFDILTIAAVADELAARLLDGRIQRIGLVDARTLAAEVYAAGERHYLVASADNRLARLHLAAAMPSLDAELVTPFGLLLRKYLRGGVLVGVDQPPLERLVRISIAKRLPPHQGRRRRSTDVQPAAEDEPWQDGDDDLGEGEGEATYVHLAVELMGRHSNLILVDDAGRIMESAKRVTPAMSRVRPILPRLPYLPPPPITKADPRRLTAAEAAGLIAGEAAETELARALVRWLRGISPQMAREIAFRATGDAAAAIGELPPEAATLVARETRALLEPLLTSAWAPRLYRVGEKGGEGGGVGEGAGATSAAPVVAFAAVPMAHLAATRVEEAVGSISAAAERAMGEEATGGPVRHAQRRERLLAALRSARQRQERRLAAVQEQGAKASEAERLRESGELIYAFLWQIEPGQRELVVDGRSIPLDPNLSGKENAQAYFERYRKAQGAGGHLPHLAAAAEAELAYLDQLRTQTDQAGGFAELEALAAEWTAHAGPPERGKPRRRVDPRRPRPLRDADGNAVYIGRSGTENDLVTFDLAGPNDTWLHARGVAGSHVVVRWRLAQGDVEAPATIAAAASLAAYYSAARGGASVEVDVTRRRYVRKIKGTGPGMVTYRNERTIAVRPADEAGVADVLQSG